MKLMIASDIHGSSYYADLTVAAFLKEKADRLILLGDILYHGPRNALPRDYDPQKTAELLNTVKDRILCVRGNCDAEVDQYLLQFPVLAEYMCVCSDERVLYCVHGHKEFPAGTIMPSDAVILSGHTHIPCCKEENGVLHCNPGSVSIPKKDSCHSYMTMEGSAFFWKDLETGLTYRRHE